METDCARNMKKVVIFGATGNAGLCVTEAAVKKGWKVRAFVRDAQKLPEELASKVEVIVGNALVESEVDEAVEGMDAVIIMLGTRSDLSATTDLSNGTKNIVAAMKKHNVQQVSACLSAFLFFPPTDLPPRFIDLTADHNRMYKVLKESGLDYIAVFPPHIADEPYGDTQIEINPEKSPGRAVSKDDLGKFFVDSLDEPKYYKSIIGLCNRPKPQ